MTNEVAQIIQEGLGGSEDGSRRSFPTFNQLFLCSCITCSSQLQPSPTHGQSPAVTKLCIQSLKGAITVPARVVLPLTTVVVRTHTHSSTSSHKLGQSMSCNATLLAQRARPSCKFSFAALSMVKSALFYMQLKSRSRSTFKTCAHRRRSE